LFEKADKVLSWIPFLKYVDVLLDFIIVCVFENGRDLSLVQLAWFELENHVALSWIIIYFIPALLLCTKGWRLANVDLGHVECDVSFQRNVSLIKMSYPFREVETLLMLLLTCVTYECTTRLDEPKRGFANIKRNMGSLPLMLRCRQAATATASVALLAPRNCRATAASAAALPLPPRCCHHCQATVATVTAAAATLSWPPQCFHHRQCRAATTTATTLLPSCRHCRCHCCFHSSSLLSSLPFPLPLPPLPLVDC
jgi:hypothetical protein